MIQVKVEACCQLIDICTTYIHRIHTHQVTGQVEVEELDQLIIGIVYSGECEKLAKEMFGVVRCISA